MIRKIIYFFTIINFIITNSKIVNKELRRSIILTNNNTVSLTNEVNDDSISSLINELYILHHNKENNINHIYIYLDTPGGSVEAGNRLIETIDFLSHSYNISCIAHHIASMGFVILQSCPNRLALKTSTLMQHQISSLISDEKQRMKTYMKYMDDLENELLEMQSKRINMSINDFIDITYHNWWLTGTQALKYNVIDEIITLGCDESLLDTYFTANASLLTGSISVMKYSKCPLIHKPISTKYEDI